MVTLENPESPLAAEIMDIEDQMTDDEVTDRIVDLYQLCHYGSKSHFSETNEKIREVVKLVVQADLHLYEILEPDIVKFVCFQVGIEEFKKILVENGDSHQIFPLEDGSYEVISNSVVEAREQTKMVATAIEKANEQIKIFMNLKGAPLVMDELNSLLADIGSKITNSSMSKEEYHRIMDMIRHPY